MLCGMQAVEGHLEHLDAISFSLLNYSVLMSTSKSQSHPAPHTQPACFSFCRDSIMPYPTRNMV